MKRHSEYSQKRMRRIPKVDRGSTTVDQRHGESWLIVGQLPLGDGVLQARARVNRLRHIGRRLSSGWDVIGGGNGTVRG